MAGKTAGVATKSSRIGLIRWLRAFLPFAIILVVDPFGCSNIADAYSERILLRLAAPFYGNTAFNRHDEPTAGQRKVTVLLIDDASLHLFDDEAPDGRATWPPARGSQFFNILRPVLQKHPAAVLIDWTFYADQPTSAEAAAQYEPATREALLALVRETSAGRAKPPRLFLGSKPLFSNPQSRCPLQWVMAGEVRQANDVAPAFRRWTAEDRVEIVTLRSYSSPHYIALPYQLDRWPASSPPAPGDCAGFDPAATYLASPAGAMFAEYCAREGATGLCRNPLTVSPHAREPLSGADGSGGAAFFGYDGRHAPSTPFALFWPGFRTPEQVGIDRQIVAAHEMDLGSGAPQPGPPGRTFADRVRECEAMGAGPLPRFRLSLKLLWTSIVGPSAEPCEYGVTLISLADYVELQRNDTEPDIFRGRYVFIGLDLASVPDTIASPVYAHAPGVLQHAVALENLITRGGRVLHDPPRIWRFDGAKLVVFIIGLMLSLVPLLLPVPRMIARIGRVRPRAGGIALLIFTGLVIATGLPLLIGVALTVTFAWAPVNWVSLLPAMSWLIGDALDAVEMQASAAGSIELTARLERLVTIGIGLLIVILFLRFL